MSAANDERQATAIGARTGLLVSGLVVPLAFLLRIPTTDPFSSIIVVIPTLVAGWLGGRQVGPWAARARTPRNWLAVVLRLGLLTILIGAPIVALELAMVGVTGELAAGTTPPLLVIPKVLLGAALLTALGTTFAGPFVSLATIPAAAIWAALVRRQLRTWMSR